MLKKQTVWLLTMLSLVVVLSVYYITSPEGGTGNEMAAVNPDQKQKDKTEGALPGSAKNEKAADSKGEAKSASGEDGTVVSAVESDELFTSLRMELEDQRSELKSQLKSIVASKDASAEQKSKAYEQMKELSEIQGKEDTLETLIKSEDYDDALVRVEDNQVLVTVKAKKHSAANANDIIMLVRSEIAGMENVAVSFEPAK
ncbi:SpoIIIAH-like family protein [Bacillus sp. FJAT-42376]|uniref:SpoIIIAH-like family protein n=1 Tax=Bacillus sp. FJAT-42376 TaxID=2014076 RepID=UPI000F4D559F|nr:SpoIIIAH-like family protein [Bacillus sp. FJAT-42376]AZB44900.1 SpoIIIAH-like family protein [Bacillus sp. FJAT-42376]